MGVSSDSFNRLKANHALFRRESFFKDKTLLKNTPWVKSFRIKKGTPEEIAANRKRLKLQLEKDRRNEKIYFIVAGGIVVFIAVFLFSSEKFQYFYNAFFSANAW